MAMSHVRTCKTCSSPDLVVVHPNSETCPQEDVMRRKLDNSWPTEHTHDETCGH